jgi:hypothetical protein
MKETNVGHYLEVLAGDLNAAVYQSVVHHDTEGTSPGSNPITENAVADDVSDSVPDSLGPMVQCILHYNQ